MKHKTEEQIEKHTIYLQYLKLQRKKLNGKIRSEIKALKRMTNEKSKKYSKVK